MSNDKCQIINEILASVCEIGVLFFNFACRLLLDISFFFVQNHRIWSSENPHPFVETRLQPIKVGVWIAASRRRLIAFIVKIKEPVINKVT
jgi:hypothetical protein